MDVELISPEIKESYSRVLYNWMKGHPYEKPFGIYELPHIENSYNLSLYSRLYIGTYKECSCCLGDFYGDKLSNILINSRNIFTIEKIKLNRRIDLEETYLKIGICAFDPEHELSHVGARWEIDTFNMMRTCKFCGYAQKQEWKDIITTKRIQTWEESKQLVLPFKENEII